MSMAKKNVGPKGQILIPKPMREAIGIKPGVDVVVELRDEEIVISKPKVEGNYTEYYVSTSAPKLKKPVKIKDLILQEASDRHALS
jgi:AbrB family looped-hinge helix DNA binding protein